MLWNTEAETMECYEIILAITFHNILIHFVNLIHFAHSGI